MDIIKIKNLKFGYDNKIILENVNMSIEKGDFVCFLGKSGCGKSTLLRLIAGLSVPLEGEIFVKGDILKNTSKHIGMVFQDYSLFPWMTTGNNIIIAMKQKFKNLSKAELTERAKYFISMVGLPEDVFYKYPNELSGGMKQRCAICRLLALNPDIFLMDEPFGALDAITRNSLQNLIIDLWQQNYKNKKTIIFVTHDVDEAIKLGTKIFLFGSNNGELIFSFNSPNSRQLEDENEKINLRNKLLRYMNNSIIY